MTPREDCEGIPDRSIDAFLASVAISWNTLSFLIYQYTVYMFLWIKKSKFTVEDSPYFY